MSFSGEIFSFDLEDGSLVRVSPPGQPDITALLGDSEHTWHHPPRRWGKGFVITSHGSARWHHPEKEGEGDPSRLRYVLDRVGLVLTVERALVGDTLEECYTLSNAADHAVQIGCLAISVPFRDVYPSASECLRGAFHAHVWTGGHNSWIWAEPMSGRGPGVGLDLLDGALWSYSVENRDHFISSNIRGHLYLHLTDHARNPSSFGGQPELLLEAKASLKWSWRLGWHSNFSVFQSGRKDRDFSPPQLAARVGERLQLEVSSCRVLGTEDVRITPDEGGGVTLEGAGSGIRWVEVGEGNRLRRAAILFHHSLEKIVSERVKYILAHQQAKVCEPTREGAFLCFDRNTGLTEIGGAWGDWSDGRERLAMPILIQESLRRGWSGSEAADALEHFRSFASRFLLSEGCAVLGGSYELSTKRLYNYPWMSEFFRNEYRRTGRIEDLCTSADILESYYAKGGRKFLGFLYGVRDLIDLLQRAGETRRAEELRENVIAQAREFRDMGVNLPNHEVNYEQSIVAPLALLLITAQKLLPQEDWTSSIRQVLAWLGAFEGAQPDARLCGVPIRHWDGFWFGRQRLWGDVVPHYWSVLSAGAYMEAASLYREQEKEFVARASRIFRANLSNFHDDGFASCAFVYPSCVNGLPAHSPDPLANDQDWALVWLLRYFEQVPWANELR